MGYLDKWSISVIESNIEKLNNFYYIMSDYYYVFTDIK